MNTPPLSNPPQQTPPAWHLTFADQTWATSDTAAWSDLSVPITLDGATVYETTKPIACLRLKDVYGQIHSLVPPQDRAIYLFAFRRNAVPAGSTGEATTPRWLYSCFGYALPTYRVLLIATPTGITSSLSPRLTPFLP